jgi:hypothetical protein
MSKADAHSTLSHFYVYALVRESGVPFYIGKGCGDRWLHHEKRARNGVSGYKHEIIRGMHARGLEVIKIKLHEGLTEAVAHAYEVALIAAIGRRPIGPLANLTDGGDGVSGLKRPPGRKLSPETIAKIAASQRGKAKPLDQIARRSATRRGMKLSAESRANIGAGARGRQKSPQECANIAAAHRGMKASPEARANMSTAQSGKTMSAEARAKMSAVHRGEKHSPEHVANQQAARRGYTHSPETRARLVTSHLGKKLSPETIAKRSATQRANAERRRAEAPLLTAQTT